MAIFKKAVLVVCSGLIIASFSACKKEGPAERAGKSIDETAEKAGKKIDQTVDKAGDKLKEAGEKIKESTK